MPLLMLRPFFLRFIALRSFGAGCSLSLFSVFLFRCCPDQSLLGPAKSLRLRRAAAKRAETNHKRGTEPGQ